MKAIDPEISTDQATCSTVEVAIRVVRIGRKQMTLAIFRQLPEREIIARDGTLDGIPWGWVNYEVPDAVAQRNFIYTRDGRLYRSLVVMSDHARPYQLTGEKWTQGRYVNRITGEERQSLIKEGPDWSEANWSWHSAGYVKAPTGKWGAGIGHSYTSGLTWDSWEAADNYCSNRLASIAVLAEMEQLFIAV